MSPFFKNYLCLPETDVFFHQKSFKILVDPDADAFGTGDNTKDCRLAIAYMHRICEHVKKRKVVLNDHHRTTHGKIPDQFCCSNSLVNIQKRGNFIKEIEVCVTGKACSNRNSLKFAPAQCTDIMIE